MRTLSTILLVVLLSMPTLLFGFAAKKDSAKIAKKRKQLTNIEFIDSKFAFRPTYTWQTALWQITDKNGVGQRLNYVPNVVGSAGLQLKIKGFVLSYSHRIPLNNSLQEKYGNTEYENIDIKIQTRIVGMHFYYLRYRGFYLDDPDRFDTTWAKDDPYPQLNDMQVFSIGYKMHFVFTKKFSLNAAFAQTERQKKSAGSFMLMFADRFTQVDTEESLVPASQTKQYGDFSGFSYGRFNTFYSAAGVGYSFVKGSFNFTPILLVGAGLQVQSYRQNTNNKFALKVPLYFQYKNAIGINGKNLYIRLINTVEYDSTPLRDTKMELFYLTVEMSIGFRL